MRLLSSAPRRQRFEVAALKSRPRLAAAVEITIRKSLPVLSVRANPLTGRVLIYWAGPAPVSDLEATIARAIEAGPLGRDAWLALQAGNDRGPGFVAKLVVGGCNLVLLLVN
ncbi:MAG TPA: hypothetical protein VIX89_20660, partial [Bryobacteraceae bacterium]